MVREEHLALKKAEVVYRTTTVSRGQSYWEAEVKLSFHHKVFLRYLLNHSVLNTSESCCTMTYGEHTLYKANGFVT